MTLTEREKHLILWAFGPISEKLPTKTLPTFEELVKAFNETCDKRKSNLTGTLLDTGDVSKRRFENTIFLGNGEYSILRERTLHDRLQFALSELSVLQQGIETESDEARQINRNIKDVLRDIAAALLGETIEFTGKIQEPVDYLENEDPFLKNI